MESSDFDLKQPQEDPDHWHQKSKVHIRTWTWIYLSSLSNTGITTINQIHVKLFRLLSVYNLPPPPSVCRTLTMPACSASLLCLLLLLLGRWVLSICPSVCLCSRGHRVVDCSSRDLTKLPPGLQHNIHFLNLSFNRWVPHSVFQWQACTRQVLQVTGGTVLVLQPWSR